MKQPLPGLHSLPTLYSQATRIKQTLTSNVEAAKQNITTSRSHLLFTLTSAFEHSTTHHIRATWGKEARSC